MKLLFSIFFFCIMTLPCLAQDSLKAASTLSFKPLVGLGLLNGARAGLQIQYNDIIAIEGGGGIVFVPILLYFFESDGMKDVLSVAHKKIPHKFDVLSNIMRERYTKKQEITLLNPEVYFLYLCLPKVARI
ncbi:MAG: hypothetical protein ACK5C0_08830 [Candidatus Kapaibacterium sp.]|jgi:hypothetical protein